MDDWVKETVLRLKREGRRVFINNERTRDGYKVSLVWITGLRPVIYVEREG